MSAIETIKSELGAVEPERIRWVRYAADCAERVVDITGPNRSLAEAAIRAAREWADDPTPERVRTCKLAVIALDPVTDPASAGADTAAAASAAWAAEAVYSQDPVSEVAGNAEYTAAYASWDSSERAWQADRRRIYGLEIDPMGDGGQS